MRHKWRHLRRVMGSRGRFRQETMCTPAETSRRPLEKNMFGVVVQTSTFISTLSRDMRLLDIVYYIVWHPTLEIDIFLAQNKLFGVQCQISPE